MRKKLIIIVPLVCFIVVGITFYMIFDIKNKVEEVNYGTDNIVPNEVANLVNEEGNSVVEENVVNDENTVNNTASNTTSTNTIVESNELSDEDDDYSSVKLEQAKNLVKKAWGEDSTVYFTNEGINSDGLYVVAARDKNSTAVKNYFKVNLSTKKVEIDY